MPNPSHHQIKAKTNRKFLDSFEWLDYSDWAVVVAFYTAVHLVEQLRALDGQDSKSHQDRLQYVQANHRAIHTEFHQLLNVSKLARYEANSVFYGQFSNSDVADIVIKQWLTTIEKYVEKYVLDRTAALPPTKPSSPKPVAPKKK